MSLNASYSSLVAAELDYARFNAQRTGEMTDGQEIHPDTRGPISFLSDPSRPDRPYYNRAVPPTESADWESALKHLPPTIQVIEVLKPQQTQSTADVLTNAGFVPGSKLCYLMARPTEPVSISRRVERLYPEQTDEFFDLLELSGAEFSAEKREKKSDYYCDDQFRGYVAYAENGEPTGWATLFVSGNTGFFANAYTLPKFRRQGFHSALLLTRWNEMVALGLEFAFTDVEPDSPSHQNCERNGFEMLTNNVIWQRAPLSS